VEITLDKWDTAVDSQATAFLVGAREAVSADAGRSKDCCDHVRAGRTVWKLATLGCDGSGEGSNGGIDAIFRRRPSRGITVNTISPGWIEDSVLNNLPEVFQTGLREWQERGWTSMGRLGTPTDIGNAVAQICAPEAGLDHRSI
jgi:hypothetical protein